MEMFMRAHSHQGKDYTYDEPRFHTMHVWEGQAAGLLLDDKSTGPKTNPQKP